MKEILSLGIKKLGFGAMRLPKLSDESIDQEATNKMIDAFLSSGFTYFDTAYCYGDGASEHALRDGLVRRHERSSYLIADKIPTWEVKQPEDYEKLFSTSLERLGTDYIDFLLLHNLGKANYDIAKKTGGFDYIQKAKAEGRAKYAGFSFHDEASVLEEILSEHPEVDFVQLQINYADWESASVQSRLCYEAAEKRGIPVIVMEPVRGGALADTPPDIARLLYDANPAASQASWAVRFAASLPGVAVVLSGMSNLKQVLDNVSYMKDFTPLSAEEKKVLCKARELLSGIGTIPCTSCHYCTPDCPQGIPIPEIFSVHNSALLFGEANFPSMHYERVTEGRGKAGSCISCGSCESHCPQHIGIIRELAAISAKYDKE